MDYYATLGLQRNASDAEIKKAYRSMAMKYHPDRGGDEKKFKEISQAYEFLSDPQKKQIIDLGGDPNSQPGMGGGQNPFEFHFNTGNMHDIFGNFGFGGFGRQPQRRNRSLNINVEITLEDVLSGKDFTAEVSIPGKNKMINIQIPPGIEHVGSHYRALYGVEVGNLMDRKKASYLRYGSANWQMGIAILEAVGKTLTPTLVPISKDGSFTALGKYYG